MNVKLAKIKIMYLKNVALNNKFQYGYIFLTLFDFATYSLNSSIKVLDKDISLNIPSSFEVN